MVNKARRVTAVFAATMLLQLSVSHLGLIAAVPSYLLKLVLSQLVLALPSLIYLAAIKAGSRGKELHVLRDEALVKKTDVITILLALAIAVLMRPLLMLINYISSFFTTPVITDLMGNVALEVPFIAALPAVAIIPAILEETVYRGVFFAAYREVFPRAAILISSLMFGILHGNLNQFIYAVVSGLIFCMVVEAAGSVVPVMAMHFAVNAVSLVLLYYQGTEGYADSFVAKLGRIEDTKDVLILIAVTIVCTAACVWIYTVMARRNKTLDHVKAIFKKNDMLK